MSGTSMAGGMSTTYVSAAEQERQRREERDARARAYLIRTGNADLLSMLGLAPAPPPGKRVRVRGGA